MKKLLVPLIVCLCIGITACGGGAPTQVPSQPDVSTVVAETVQAMTAAAPAATSQPEIQGIPASYENVSFVIPQGLATGTLAGTVNDTELHYIYPDPAFPSHIKITLQGYNVSSGLQAGIAVLKSNDAIQYNDIYQTAISTLQNLQWTATQPIPEAISLGYLGAPQVVNFKNGHGIRYLAQINQGPAPINNQELFYYFQGITNDNAYFVVAVLPLHASFLATNSSSDPSAVPPDGIPFPGFTNPNASSEDIQAYYKAISNKLDASAPDVFSPLLAELDALIQSIQINP